MADIQKQTIVVADNDPDFLKWVEKHLEAKSLDFYTTSSADEALSRCSTKPAASLISPMRTTKKFA
jgi:DNA-binding NtrC family response regulator